MRMPRNVTQEADRDKRGGGEAKKHFRRKGGVEPSVDDSDCSHSGNWGCTSYLADTRPTLFCRAEVPDCHGNDFADFTSEY